MTLAAADGDAAAQRQDQQAGRDSGGCRGTVRGRLPRNGMHGQRQ